MQCSCFMIFALIISSDISMNLGPINPTEEFQLLNYHLNMRNFQAVPIPGDGSCFFHSVSHQIYGDQNYDVQIQYTCVAYLSQHETILGIS